MSNKTRYWLPSFTDLFFCCVFLRLTLAAGSWLLNDADTGLHIRAGEYILHNFAVPNHDIFSYISPPLPWVAHEWLSEVIMALVHGFSGLTGIVIFFSFLIGLTYFLLFRIAHSLDCNFLITALIALLATVSSSIHWFARPHIFSLLLTVVWYAILDNYQYKRKDSLYLLPFLMLLWVNLHGGFIVGFLLLGVYFAGNVTSVIFASEHERRIAKTRCEKIALFALLSLFASLINPRGYQLLVFPFSLVSSKFITDTVLEHLSPNFHQPLPYKYLLLLTIGIFSVSRKRLNVTESLLVLLFTYMSLYASRHIPLFAIIITPILLRHLQSLLQKFDNRLTRFFLMRSNNLELINASAKGHLWPLISLVAVCAFALDGKIEFKFDESKLPVAAVEFLKNEKVSGNMFNDDEFGDYLIYAAWPEYKVFIDGREDVYGELWVRQYLRVANIQPGWNKVIDQNNITWVFSSAKSPLSTILLDNKEWRLIYADNVAHVYVKNIPHYQSLIHRYSITNPVT
jgi:hypothetical protein